MFPVVARQHLTSYTFFYFGSTIIFSLVILKSLNNYFYQRKWKVQKFRRYLKNAKQTFNKCVIIKEMTFTKEFKAKINNNACGIRPYCILSNEICLKHQNTYYKITSTGILTLFLKIPPKNSENAKKPRIKLVSKIFLYIFFVTDLFCNILFI